MNKKVTLSQYFKVKMALIGIDRHDLAKKINMNYKTLSGKFVRNKFDDETLIKICAALDIEISDLIKIINS